MTPNRKSQTNSLSDKKQTNCPAFPDPGITGVRTGPGPGQGKQRYQVYLWIYISNLH